MIASGTINKHLSWAFEECFVLASLEGETLGEILSARRDDLKGTPKFLSQGQMTKRVRQEFGEKALSQGRVSYFENDLADFMTLQPEIRLSLLKLYHFTEQELNTLNDRFSLRLPLARESVYLNKSGSDPLKSAIVWINDLAGERGGSYPMDRETLEREGVTAEDCKGFVVDADVLMPEPLRDMIPDKTVLFCTPKVTPKVDNLLTYTCRDSGKKVLIQHSERGTRVPVMSADGSDADFVSENDERLEFVGVSIGRYTAGR